MVPFFMTLNFCFSFFDNNVVCMQHLFFKIFTGYKEENGFLFVIF